MIPKSMSHKFQVALQNRGFKFVKHTSKYAIYSKGDKNHRGKTLFMYVGKSGALRLGTSAATSVVMSNNYKQKLLDEFETLKEQGELDRSQNLRQ